MTRHQIRQAHLDRYTYRTTLAQERSFAARVRRVITDKGPVRLCEISDWLDLVTPVERHRVSSTLRDLLRAGKVVRVEKGVYAPAPESAATAPPEEKRQVMWRILRAQKKVHRDDLVALAGVTKGYASEWLGMLVKRGVARREPNGVHRLIHDTVAMPDLTDNAEKLRALRASVKARQAATRKALEKARQAIDQAIGQATQEV